MAIVIGKYTLESLTTGMYKDPFILYREYIQNSTDSLDEAFNRKMISSGEEYINIIINEENGRIVIEDNGVGIESEDAYKVLTDIGNSKKRYTSHKGFRGIGRLGGLSYCEKIIFETSYFNENKKTRVEFNGDRLKELLIPGCYENYTMEDVIEEITSNEIQDEEKEKHYFRVILEGVSKKHQLLNMKKIEGYLKQVAPIEFNKTFIIADKIKGELQKLKLEDKSYNIYIGKENQELTQIYKPYMRRFYADISKKIEDSIEDIVVKIISDDFRKKIVAVVWYGKSNLFGTVADETVKGLRLRKSGILIGDRFLLNELFKEDRFNGWIQGEVLVFDDKIIPNARRDDFEKNDEYLFLLEKLKEVTSEISSEIRSASQLRALRKNQSETVSQLNQLPMGINSVQHVSIEKQTVSDDVCEELFDKLDDENDDDIRLCENIERILKEELKDDVVLRIIEKIKKMVDKIN